MMIKMEILVFLLTILLSVKSLSDGVTGRRLLNTVTSNFNDKYCVNFGSDPQDWQTYFGGEYQYKGMENGKPSYKMSKCNYPNKVECAALQIILHVNSDGKWEFFDKANQPSYPTCNTKTEKPQQCQSWWQKNPINLYECGSDHTENTGQSTGGSTGGSSSGAPTSQAMLDVHNEIRRLTANGKMVGAGNRYLPQAADMIKLKWDDALAWTAQQHSDLCNLQMHHSEGQELRNRVYKAVNTLKKGSFAYGSDMVNSNYLGNVGENLAGYIGNDDILAAIRDRLAKNEALNHNGNKAIMDHFNQIANSHTQYVGCAYNPCTGKLQYGVLTCNYYPYYGTNAPLNGDTYLIGSPASKCPKGSSPASDGNGLCISNKLIFPYSNRQ